MSEGLNQLLKDNYDVLLTEWFEQAIAAYPAEAHKYFVKVKNEFTNPVGSTIYNHLAKLLTELSGDRDADKLYQHLEMILKVRAVQDMKPSKALAFIPSFKSIVQNNLKEQIKKGAVTQAELQNLFSDLDTLLLLAFDLYDESRELIYKLRITEIKQQNDILQKANLLNEKVDTSTFMKCSSYMEMENQKDNK